jgi:oxygen-dependent protoporphyrinogen oxidase
MKIVVVGAGIAGLAAAYRLSQCNHEVTVLEASDRIGGRIYAVEFEGFRFQAGARITTGADNFLVNLIHNLGLDLQPKKNGLTSAVYRDGRFQEINLLSPKEILSALSLPGKLGLFRMAPYLLLSRPPSRYHLEQAAGPDSPETMPEFLYSHGAEEAYNLCFWPQLQVLCNYLPEDLSRKAFLALFASYLGAKTIHLADGMDILPRRLAEHSKQVVTNAVVRCIEADTTGQVTVSYDGKTHQQLTADRVVVATPASKARRLFQKLRPAWRNLFSQVAYSQSCTVFFTSESDYQPTIHHMIVPDTKIGISSMGFQERRGKEWLIECELRPGTFCLSSSDDVLALQAEAGVTMLFPLLKDTIRSRLVVRWPEQVPCLRPGYLDALKRFWTDPQEGPVFFCGDYLAGPSVAGAMYTGLECADRLMAWPLKQISDQMV